jgi:hypothetical protein
MDDYYDRKRREEASSLSDYRPGNPRYEMMETSRKQMWETPSLPYKGKWFAPLLPFLILVGAAIVAIIQGP